MKFCSEYNQKTERNKYIKDFDEWKIDYNPNDSTLIEFLELHQDKKIILRFGKNINNFILCKELCDRFKNIKILLTYVEGLEEIVCEYCFPYFYDNLVSTWDEYLGLIDLGVTDVYIVEALGFELELVSKIAKENDVRIRVFPNVAQSTWVGTPAIQKFFIRPEDIDFYSQYVDAIEFFYKEPKHLDVYYEVYAINKKWSGMLNEIIMNFESNLDNRFILPRFAKRRINCNRNCLKGGKCRICYNIIDLSQTLKDNNLGIKIDIKKEKESNNG